LGYQYHQQHNFILEVKLLLHLLSSFWSNPISPSQFQQFLFQRLAQSRCFSPSRILRQLHPMLWQRFLLFYQLQPSCLYWFFDLFKISPIFLRVLLILQQSHQFLYRFLQWSYSKNLQLLFLFYQKLILPLFCFLPQNSKIIMLTLFGNSIYSLPSLYDGLSSPTSYSRQINFN